MREQYSNRSSGTVQATSEAGHATSRGSPTAGVGVQDGGGIIQDERRPTGRRVPHVSGAARRRAGAVLGGVTVRPWCIISSPRPAASSGSGARGSSLSSRVGGTRREHTTSERGVPSLSAPGVHSGPRGRGSLRELAAIAARRVLDFTAMATRTRTQVFLERLGRRYPSAAAAIEEDVAEYRRLTPAENDAVVAGLARSAMEILRGRADFAEAMAEEEPPAPDYPALMRRLMNRKHP